MKRWIVIILTAVFFFQGCSSKNREELIREYTEKAELEWSAENYIRAVGWIERAINEAKKEYGETSVEVAELYLRESEMADYAIEVLGAIQYAETIYEDLNDEVGLVKISYYYGDYYSRLGDFDQAVEQYEKVMEFSEGLGEEVNEWKFYAYFNEAFIASDENKSILF